jgi:DNA processing protein
LDHEEVAAAIVLQETPADDSPEIGPRERQRPGPPRRQGHEERPRAATPLATMAAASPTDPARKRWERRPVRAQALASARRFARVGGRLVLRASDEFPARVRAFPWCPPWLWVRGGGRFPALAVAMVGTRRATPSACAFAERLAAGAARAGITVVSGLALGIDSAAHRGALSAGGSTLAVLGTGVDRCYPAANRPLLAKLLESGLAVSELPPGALPLRHHFPKRNLLLAGLCQAVVVVQAPAASGALITAAHAGDTGAELLTVPGDPVLPENAGSNWLLTLGIRPALGVEDVVSAVLGHEVRVAERVGGAGEAGGPAGGGSEALSPLATQLLAALDFVPRGVDQVVAEMARPIAEVLAEITVLELRGWIETLAGGRARLTPQAAEVAARARGPARSPAPGPPSPGLGCPPGGGA